MLKLSNPRITPVHIDRLNALLDLDKPLLPGQYCPKVGGEQQPCRFDQGRYFRWLGKVVKGDWGTVVDDADRHAGADHDLEPPGLHRLAHGALDLPGDCAGGAHRHLFRRQAILDRRLRGDGAGVFRPVHAHLLDRLDGDGHLCGGAGLVPHQRRARGRRCRATSSRRWRASFRLGRRIPTWPAKNGRRSWMACATWPCRRSC